MNEKHKHSLEKPHRSLQSSDMTHGHPPTHGHHKPLRAPPPAKHPPSSGHTTQARSPLNPFSERKESRRASRDPEKASYDRHSIPSHHPSNRHPSHAYSEGEEDDEFGGEEDDPKRHAVWILIFLSALAPLLTLPIALYTLFVTILLLMLSPIFLILKQLPLSTRFYSLLAPPREWQLGWIFSSHETNAIRYHSAASIVILVLVNIFSPVYATVIAMAAWVGGVFWFYTAILGNPDGKEERDDGREAVLAVRGCWEKWLVQGLA